jgi:hypothetical protein
VWANTFTIPAGNWEYKVALNGSWDVNYGVGAVPDGPNLTLCRCPSRPRSPSSSATAPGGSATHDHVLANVPGSFQSEVGCPGDWDPSCYRTWLQDIDGDGVYTYLSPGAARGRLRVQGRVGAAGTPTTHGQWGQDYGVGGPGQPERHDRRGPAAGGALPAASPGCDVAVEAEVLGLDEAPGTPIEPVHAGPPPTFDRDYAVVHYQRDAGDEDDWGLHLWGDVDQTEGTEWGTPLPFRGETDYGRFAWIKLAAGRVRRRLHRLRR